mmetsp:Transcript_68697/g.210678  ORF Transcript_68697/g.210678 Transcript_68697/m.210678 type:complete len:225 (-) Transcript_68697:472-1146(-)
MSVGRRGQLAWQLWEWWPQALWHATIASYTSHCACLRAHTEAGQPLWQAPSLPHDMWQITWSVRPLSSLTDVGIDTGHLKWHSAFFTGQAVSRCLQAVWQVWASLSVPHWSLTRPNAPAGHRLWQPWSAPHPMWQARTSSVVAPCPWGSGRMWSTTWFMMSFTRDGGSWSKACLVEGLRRGQAARPVLLLRWHATTASSSWQCSCRLAHGLAQEDRWHVLFPPQ